MLQKLACLSLSLTNKEKYAIAKPAHNKWCMPHKREVHPYKYTNNIAFIINWERQTSNILNDREPAVECNHVLTSPIPLYAWQTLQLRHDLDRQQALAGHREVVPRQDL
jgi:hypothetical protein